jgi:hypothetical protein
MSPRIGFPAVAVPSVAAAGDPWQYQEEASWPGHLGGLRWCSSSGISAERPEFVREASIADAKHQIAGALTEPPDGWMAPIYELFSDIQPLKRIKLTPPRRADIDLSVTRRILDIERVV